MHNFFKVGLKVNTCSDVLEKHNLDKFMPNDPKLK